MASIGALSGCSLGSTGPIPAGNEFAEEWLKPLARLRKPDVLWLEWYHPSIDEVLVGFI
jgi:hypothetical protein